MNAKQSLANAETGKASDTRSNPDGNDTPNKLENISVSKYTETQQKTLLNENIMANIIK